ASALDAGSAPPSARTIVERMGPPARRCQRVPETVKPEVVLLFARSGASQRPRSAPARLMYVRETDTATICAASRLRSISPNVSETKDGERSVAELLGARRDLGR